MLVSNLWPGVNPSTVWDLPFELWMVYAAAHDEQAKRGSDG